MNHLILTDALTYNGIAKQVGEANLNMYRMSLNMQRIKKFLINHWDEIKEIHLYKEGTIVGLEWLTEKKFVNTEPNRVVASYGQVEVIVTVKCDKDIDPTDVMNWERGACSLDMTLIRINKPSFPADSLEDFLSGISM